METELTACPYCAETIKAAAIKCRYCGELLDPGEGSVPFRLTRSSEYYPGMALVLGLFCTGFGQFYEQRIGAGIGFLIIVMTLLIIGWLGPEFFYLLVPLVHVVAAAEAYLYDPVADYKNDYEAGTLTAVEPAGSH